MVKVDEHSSQISLMQIMTSLGKFCNAMKAVKENTMAVHLNFILNFKFDKVKHMEQKITKINLEPETREYNFRNIGRLITRYSLCKLNNSVDRRTHQFGQVLKHHTTAGIHLVRQGKASRCVRIWHRQLKRIHFIQYIQCIDDYKIFEFKSSPKSKLWMTSDSKWLDASW